MKKIILLSICTFLFLCSPTYAKTQDTFNIYLTAKLGYSATLLRLEDITTSSTKRHSLSAFNIGAAFGGQYYFMNPFGLRIEFEYLFRTKDKTSQSVDMPNSLGITEHTILTNVYLDWHVIPSVSIYMQAGVGASILSLEQEGPNTGSSRSQGNFVWQTGVGTWYAITQSTIIDFNVRYVGYATSDIHNIKMREISGIDVIFSLRYLF